MDATSACNYINEHIHYKPGWNISAEPTDRFNNAITVLFAYDAPDFSQENAPEYQARVTATPRVVMLADISEEELHHRLMHEIIKCEIHEAREAFRVGSDYVAPFHPHNHDSMKRWGDEQGDLRFGLA